MDIFIFLSLVVAAVTVISGYVLFNELPDIRSLTDPRRSARRR